MGRGMWGAVLKESFAGACAQTNLRCLSSCCECYCPPIRQPWHSTRRVWRYLELRDEIEKHLLVGAFANKEAVDVGQPAAVNQLLGRLRAVKTDEWRVASGDDEWHITNCALPCESQLGGHGLRRLHSTRVLQPQVVRFFAGRLHAWSSTDCALRVSKEPMQPTT